MVNKIPFADRSSMRPVKNGIITLAEEEGYIDISEYIEHLKTLPEKALDKKQVQYDILKHDYEDLQKKYEDLLKTQKGIA